MHACMCVHVYISACMCLYYYHMWNEELQQIHVFSLVVINVEFNITEYNVNESEQTVMLHIVANETSQFDYIVTLMLTDISTGE